MKVLALRDADGAGALVALHPEVSVVRSTDPVRRAWLRDVLSRLSGGGEPQAAGEVEAHGILFDLDAASLAILGLDHPVSAVVTADDLPGHDPVLAAARATQVEAVAARSAALATLERCRQALTDAVAERDAATAALDELLRGEGAAREALDAASAERSRLELEVASALDECGRAEDDLANAVSAREWVLAERVTVADRIEAARSRRSEAIAAATAAAAALEEARSAAEPSDDLAGALADARVRLARAVDELDEADPHHDESPVNRHLAALEQRRVELARIEASLGDPEVSRVSIALERVTSGAEGGGPVVAALALADTWRDLHQQIAALEAGVSPVERQAEERLDQARQTAAEAESEFNQPVLTPEQITKVEASHAAVLEAQDRAEGRFGGGRAKKRLEELRGEERRVLERLGFSTYADYMMSSSSRGVGQANRAILEAAQGNVSAAEEELEQLPGAGDRARRRLELLQRRDAVAPRVAALLGHEPTGPESEDELRNLREPGPADEATLAELASALLEAGINVGVPPYEREDLELLARAYLAEERSADLHRRQITEATQALDGAIGELRAARARGVVDLPDLAPLPDLARPVGADPGAEVPAADAQAVREARWREVETARAALSDLELAEARQQEARSRLEVLEAQLADATRAEASAAAALAAAEAAGGSELDARVDHETREVDEAERVLARARANHREATVRLEEHHAAAGTEPLVAAAEARRGQAEAALVEAAAAEQAAAATLAQCEAAVPAAESGLAAAEAAAAELDRHVLVEDFTWRLLGRVAAVRSVGLAGSVPVVFDDPFAVLHDHEIAPVLDRVLQMAGAVQVVILSDRDAVASWADGQGGRVGVLAA